MTNQLISNPDHKLPITIRAVVFDIGGVLIRTGDPTPRRRWETQLGLSEGKLSQLAFGTEVARRGMIGQANEADVWQEVSRVLTEFSINNVHVQHAKSPYFTDVFCDPGMNINF